MYVCGACVTGHLNLGSACKMLCQRPQRKRKMRRSSAFGLGGVGVVAIPHIGPLDQLLPVYCCIEVLSCEDNKALTFDSSGTGAHPATDAILFSVLSHTHHTTAVTLPAPILTVCTSYWIIVQHND